MKPGLWRLAWGVLGFFLTSYPASSQIIIYGDGDKTPMTEAEKEEARAALRELQELYRKEQAAARAKMVSEGASTKELAAYVEPKVLSSSEVDAQVQIAKRAVKTFLTARLWDKDASVQRDAILAFLRKVKKNIEGLSGDARVRAIAKDYNGVVSYGLVTLRDVPFAWSDAADFFCQEMTDESVTSYFVFDSPVDNITELLRDLDAPKIAQNIPQDLTANGAEAIASIIVARARWYKPWEGDDKKSAFTSLRLDEGLIQRLAQFSNARQVEAFQAVIVLFDPFLGVSRSSLETFVDPILNVSNAQAVDEMKKLVAKTQEERVKEAEERLERARKEQEAFARANPKPGRERAIP
jgi:hypothetical protein